MFRKLTILLGLAHVFFMPVQVCANDFTFKRVKPPAAGATKRINIYIEKTWPYETDDPLFPASTKGSAAPEAAAPEAVPEAWFWDAVTGDLAAANPKRLDRALQTLGENPAQAQRFEPHLPTLDKILKTHGPAILMATAGKRVSPALVLSVIAVESAGRPDAVSQKGAQGLMQLIPATAERFGVKDPSDPVQNISGGAAYLDWLMGEFKGDPLLSLAGYNAGENAVRGHNGVPPFAETRAYVPKVIATWSKARMYCQTLPRRMDDGCVFAFERSLSQ